MSIVTLTFDLQNQKSSSSGHSEHVCKVWWIGTQWFSFYRVHKVKGTDARTEPQHITVLYPHCNGDDKTETADFKIKALQILYLL